MVTLDFPALSRPPVTVTLPDCGRASWRWTCVGMLWTALMLAACGSIQQQSGYAVFSDCDICPEMMVVPAGRFLMGTSDEDPENWSPDREGPRHPVTIARGFAIGRFEITRQEYWRFVEATGRNQTGCASWTGESWKGDVGRNWRNPGFAQTDRDPVVCVSWSDAKAFADWLAKLSGKPYRLATEAEWEYAASAGSITRRFWGDGANEACAFANVGDRSMQRELGWTPFADCEDGYAHTAPVGSYRSNAWGLHDMLGNVWEWTGDCWTDGENRGYRGAPEDGSARAWDDCPIRVTRGAAWNSNPRNVRTTNRGNFSSTTPYDSVGFRVVRSLD